MAAAADSQPSCPLGTRPLAGLQLTESVARCCTAEAALVTVPLGVLKADSIRFQPPLPPRKQDAIARMGFGILNKVVENVVLASGEGAHVRRCCNLSRCCCSHGDSAHMAGPAPSMNMLWVQVVLLFPRQFWPKDADMFGRIAETTAERGDFFLFYSYADLAGERAG